MRRVVRQIQLVRMNMISKTKYINVRQKIEKLGLSQTNTITFLPKNLHEVDNTDELIYDSSVTTLRKIFKEEGLVVDNIEPSNLKIPELQQNAFQWIGPVIFISASYYSKNPDAINIALSLISSYLKDFFKGIPGSKKVKLSIVKEIRDGDKYFKVDYEGDVSGLSELKDIIRETKDE